MLISDSQHRTFKTLRISLTNQCNLACSYCVNDDSVLKKNNGGALLGVDQLIGITKKLHHLLGLQTIRLTGGEPTLYQDIVPLIGKLSVLGPEIKLTTNGFLLKKLADQVPIGALKSINVSLDALDEDIFFKISKRRSVYRILEGIDAALQKGIEVKINCVVIKDVNDNQILDLLAYAHKKNMVIRFLELMKMGHVYQGNFTGFYSESDILKAIKSKYEIVQLTRSMGSTANYWKTDTGQVFGIIANESSPFCEDCNRLRLDSNGNIYGCLSSNEPISIVTLLDNDEQLVSALQSALDQKQSLAFRGSELSMLNIGG